MYNAQGNYDQGRGADGLGIVRAAGDVQVWRGSRNGSRYGSGVPYSTRPPYISGKPCPCPVLDPRKYLPPDKGIVLPTIVKAGGLPPVIRKPPRGPIDPLIDRPWLKDLPKQKDEAFVAAIKPKFVRRKRLGKAAKIRQRQQFINWIKNWAPEVYAAAKRKADMVEGADGALGQLGGWWETFSENVTEIGGAVLQYKTQKAILDAQLERMRAGLPPLEISEYAPTVRVQPDPGTTAQITGAIGAGFGKLLPFIAIAGVAMIFLMRRPGRRRR